MAYPNYYQGGYYPQYQNGAVPDMLNQYKGQYQPIQQGQIPMQQPIMQQAPIQSMPITQPTDDRIWVQGLAGAKAYFVAPNTTVVLWDTESPTIYIKSADATGKPLEIEIIDLSRRTKDNIQTAEHKCQCSGKFISKEDFKAFQDEFEILKNEVEELKAKPKAKANKKTIEETENE